MQTMFGERTEALVGDATDTFVVNSARSMSKINRKYMPMVDERGNAQLYTLAIKFTAPAKAAGLIKTASNGYATKQAVKAWHKAWRRRMKRNGVSVSDLGKYGKCLRFPLTASDSYHSSQHTGEWTDTIVVTESQLASGNAGDTESQDLVDDYTLTLTGDSVADTATGTEASKYTSVGIIKSWIQARMPVPGAAGGAIPDEFVIQQTDNPLRHLNAASHTSFEQLEVVEDMQKEEPPWSDAAGEHSSLMEQAYFQVNTNLTAEVVIEAPCGLWQYAITDLSSSTASYDWECRVLGIRDM